MTEMDQFFLDFKEQWKELVTTKDHRLLQAMAYAEAMMISSLDLSNKMKKKEYKNLLKAIRKNPRPDYSIYLLGLFLSGLEHFTKDLEKTLKNLAGKQLRRFTQQAAMFHTVVSLWNKEDLQNLKKMKRLLSDISSESDMNRLQGRLLGLALVTPSCSEVVQREIIGQLKTIVENAKDENVLITGAQALTLASLGSGILEPVLTTHLELLSSNRRHVRAMASLGLSAIIPWIESSSLRNNVLETMIKTSTYQVVNGVIYGYFNLFFKFYPKELPSSLLKLLKSSENETFVALHDLFTSWNKDQSLTTFYERTFEYNHVDFWKAALLGSFYLEWSQSRNINLMKEMAAFFQHLLQVHHMSSVQSLAMNRLISVVLTTRNPTLVAMDLLEGIKQQLEARSGSSHSRQELAMAYVILRSLECDLSELKGELETMVPQLDLSGLTGLLLGLGSSLYLHLPKELPPPAQDNWLRNDEFYFGLLQWMKETRDEASLQLFQAFSQVGLQ